jgi:hypothetical protein
MPRPEHPQTLEALGRQLEPEPTPAQLRQMPTGQTFREVFALGPIARNAARRRLLAEQRAAANPPGGPDEAES